MSLLIKVRISGLWQRPPIEFTVHSDVTFLIGENGTGKTTVINLISAAMDADYETLVSVEYESIELTYRNSSTGSPMTVTVSRQALREAPFIQILYTISGDGGSSKSLNLQEYRFGLARTLALRTRELNEPIRARLKEIARTTWLSVHRASPVRNEDRTSEPSVDKRLFQLSDGLGKFFAGLNTQASAESTEFQKSVFTSLIPQNSFSEVAEVISSLNIQSEQDTFQEIIDDFVNPSTSFAEPISQYFTELRSGVHKMHGLAKSLSNPQKETMSGLSPEEGRAVMLLQIIHNTVKSWESLKSRLKEIYEPKDSFLRVLNSRSWDKDYFVNGENELEARLRSSDLVLPPQKLSSGEKQLIIITGEALLQRKQQMLYIADEPELSLHVKWQETLVDVIRAINPRAQLLLATHSPDIVSHYQSNVFDMEKLRADIH